ncbi:hypothetical protein EJ07DRAFT_151869 [Lizonia empirigonia]|nr:hypothetical protein EJ07DRAFT_151869 [Lizonia empirigonia]
MAVFYSYDANGTPVMSSIDPLEVYTPLMYGSVHQQEDPVGWYLTQQAIMKDLSVEYSTQITQSQRSEDSCDSYTNGGTPIIQPFVQFPDPEYIRHLHTLRSLLPHIQPERKLNALGGPELDIVEGHTGIIFRRAVPKKMLVLLLGRKVVSKFLHTTEREDNERWRGPPTHQKLVLPYGVTSQAAVKVLISWMIRACKFATMSSMKPIRIPKNLFASCSLAQTLELFSLHKDAYCIDSAITQQFFKRPLYPVEVETLWNCLGEDSKYVYGCIKSFANQLRRGQDLGVPEDIQGLYARHPRLYARIWDPALNEMHRPEFGRQWFAKLGLPGAGENTQVEVKDFSAGAPSVEEHAPTMNTPFPHLAQIHAASDNTQFFQTLNTFSPAVIILDPSTSVFQPLGTEPLEQHTSQRLTAHQQHMVQPTPGITTQENLSQVKVATRSNTPTVRSVHLFEQSCPVRRPTSC